MGAVFFLCALAFLLVNSNAGESPKSRKRSDILPATKASIRAAAYISDLQISSKLALLAVSTSFAQELSIEALLHALFAFD
ncbi:hypothetical protein GJ744_006704 [Endocarpon pusillum]|uniref:Secreted protein n=1 Tax=Endocarpon pusillum TaxID=364733 RepID=A0A8H7ASN2_9EURO|nr:hypothetical protein GJ744_006704 [Endocarpon pusillum]